MAQEVPAEVLETEQVPDEPNRMRHVAISPQVYDFVVAFTGVAQTLREQSKPRSRLDVVLAMQGLTRDLEAACKNADTGSVIRGCVALAAWNLLLFLSVTPQYQAVEEGQAEEERSENAGT